MLIELGIQGSFDGVFAQHLRKLVEIGFRLDVPGGCMGNRFELLLQSYCLSSPSDWANDRQLHRFS
ncbi:hypothetical protein FV139_19010 [Parahaliea maris]|uniref:Uncharacterized protein n=1 Tax=Parahaliea maris TaxID=2716870 RepID=A0A5C8ZNM7_9GAMM|nr:hypothetical protein FV139_19010 [Parahaliea maris]